MFIPSEHKEIRIWPDVTITEVRGKYAWDEGHQVGGIIGHGDGHGVEIGDSYYSTITGDSLFDSLTINGFKVYEP